MRIPWGFLGGVAVLVALIASFPAAVRGDSDADSRKHEGKAVAEEFRTSERCVACHNGMKTVAGEDYDIGKEWQASIMANSSRDPYWQASVRRESMDHPEVKAGVEDECSNCHMAVVHLTNRDAGRMTQVFDKLPLKNDEKTDRGAVDGVSCSVCHQIEDAGLGTAATFVGNVQIAKPAKGDLRPEYGPFVPDGGHQRIMDSSTRGYIPEQGLQIREAGLCGSCHTLYTKARGPGGKEVGVLPEQMPFQEWQHSTYGETGSETCQTCHMPAVNGPAPVTALYGPLRDGAREHVFVGGNFLMQGMLQDHRHELATAATKDELDAALVRTKAFLAAKSAEVSIAGVRPTATGLAFDVRVENLSGHKLPTAYPARRTWLHRWERAGGV
jgi:mono/diheme cytochrome c family protein